MTEHGGHLLVVAHEATLTGSPRVLLHLLAHVKADLGVPLAVRLQATGPLADPLRALADVEDVGRTPAAVLFNDALGVGEAWAVPPEVPVMAYVHEQGEALRVLPETATTALAERCQRVLCVAPQVAEELTALGVPPSHVGVLPPVVSARRPSGAEVAAARAELGAASGDTLIVACGEAGWRKGADLFVDLARNLVGDEGIRLGWIGRRPRSFARVLDHDTATVGAADRVVWHGEVADAVPYLAAADVVVMTSREDPQPLVPLEAALLGTPVAAFDVGGLAELARMGACRSVPYPDTAALAAEVRALAADDEGRAQVVAAAAAEVRRSRSIEVLGPCFAAELRALLGRTEGAP